MNEQTRTFISMGETLQAFSPFYQEAKLTWLRQSKAPDNWFALNPVRAGEPEAFSLDHAVEMMPYAARSLLRERYDALAADGCLEALGDDTYRLVGRGRQIVEGFFRNAHEQLAEVEALPAGEMELLAGYLERIVTSTLNNAEPVQKAALQASHWTDPGQDAPAPVRIDQYVTDLQRFRDDAHIGAWRPLGVDGKTWEALTLLWRGEANSVAELSDRLAGRGYVVAEYAAALETLLEKGWIALDGDHYQITDAGKQIRQQAEDETDRLFYAGWSALSQAELEQLDDLLARLNERLAAATLEQCWSQAGGLARAITPITRTAVNDAFNRYFVSPRTFFPTLVAYGYGSGGLSVADYSARSPYTNPDRVAELLAETAASGCLADDDERFVITDKGKEAIVQVNDLFYTYLGQIDPLPEEDAAELATFLERIVEASLAAGDPPIKLALTNMHSCHPQEQYGPLARIDQAIDDLNAFRDDVHVASWQENDVEGRDWDALTLVWRGEANTAAALAETLPFKGYSADAYTLSLTDLAERGWLEKTADGFQITDLGRMIRQKAELATDRLFFAPWQELANSERLRLHTLLTQMKLGLQELAEDES